MHCEGVSLERIALDVGTPAYVYSAATIRDRYARLDRTLSPVAHRIHYTLKANSSRGVLEVRSHEVPFLLEDGQMVGRLAYERMAEEPDGLYGRIGTSNYQGQELKLSKHFA